MSTKVPRNGEKQTAKDATARSSRSSDKTTKEFENGGTKVQDDKNKVKDEKNKAEEKERDDEDDDDEDDGDDDEDDGDDDEDDGDDDDDEDNGDDGDDGDDDDDDDDDDEDDDDDDDDDDDNDETNEKNPDKLTDKNGDDDDDDDNDKTKQTEKSTGDGKKTAKNSDDDDDEDDEDEEEDEDVDEDEDEDEGEEENDNGKTPGAETDEDEAESSGDETVSSIPSMNDDITPPMSDDDGTASQEPMLRLSAMSHVSGLSDLLHQVKVEAGEEPEEPPKDEEQKEESEKEEGEKEKEGEKEEEGKKEGENKEEKDENTAEGEVIQAENEEVEKVEEPEVESERSFSPESVNVSELDEKDSDIYGDQSVTERELSSRQDETASDGRAESAMSFISVTNHTSAIIMNKYDQEAGGLTCSEGEPARGAPRKEKSRQIMRRNKYRTWYDIPETSGDENNDAKDGNKNSRRKKKAVVKRRAESRTRSQKRRSAGKNVREKNVDVKRQKKRKPVRRRAKLRTTSAKLLIVEEEKKEVRFEDDGNSSAGSARPIESSLSIHVIKSRYDEYTWVDSSAESARPGSGSSCDSDNTRRKVNDVDIESEPEEKKVKQKRKKKNEKKKEPENKKNSQISDEKKKEIKKVASEPVREESQEATFDARTRTDDEEEKHAGTPRREDDDIRESPRIDHKEEHQNDYEDGKDIRDTEDTMDRRNSQGSKISKDNSDHSSDRDTNESDTSERTASSRAASSKWAYRTDKFRSRRSSLEEPSRLVGRRATLAPIPQKAKKKRKSPEMVVIRGIPRVIRRTKTEVLFASSSKHVEKSWGKSKHNSAKAAPRLGQEVVDRVLSANRNKVTQLENRMSQLIKELIEEREENKTLRHVVNRQERKLTEVCGDQAELPKMITKHTSEVKSLREMIRRLQETGNHRDNKLHDMDREALKLKDKCKYYRDLCESKNLIEGAALQKKLTQNENTLEKRNEEISKLQRMVNLQEKSHARQVKELNTKIRELQTTTKEMEGNFANQQDRIEMMTRQLNYGNIYQRQIVLKNKDKNNNALLEATPTMAALPAPKKKGKKAGNSDQLSPNANKAANDKDNNVGKLDVNNKKPDSFFLTTNSDTGSDREPEKVPVGQASSNEPRLSITDGSESRKGNEGTNASSFEQDQRAKEEEERRKREEFERSLREEDERLRKEKEEADRIKREVEERRRREEEEREEKWREDSARRAREENERQEAAAKRAKEEEVERRKAEEDASSFFEDEAERRKKNQLLARIRAIDQEQKGHDTEPKFGDETGTHSPRRAPGGLHETRQADKNLHNGLPANNPPSPPLLSPPASVKSDPDSVSGVPRHRPVLLGRGGLARKSNVPSWLQDDKKATNNNKNTSRSNGTFTMGDYSPTVVPSTQSKPPADNNADIFGGTGGRRHGRERRGAPDDHLANFRRLEPVTTTNNTSSFLDDGNFGRKKNADVFSATKSNASDDFWNTGPASVNSPPEHGPSNGSLLPLRRKEKAQIKRSNVYDDNLDDDIEELTL